METSWQQVHLPAAQMLFMVGPGLQAELGWTRFAVLYVAAGALANLSAYVGNVVVRRRRLWETKGASAPVYALLACTALVQPYRKFVWLFGLQLNSLGCGPEWHLLTSEHLDYWLCCHHCWPIQSRRSLTAASLRATGTASSLV